ncbi:mediator of DNA damage checkpoint protein 1 isoform 2-T6 [Odontesthes bonariensis]|uniref:mediator of DNA damage checkpoint protein 1 isoform X2 n=1 Tax=Odontesthes bonariensis TaxID=219752 RepID=UPI003F5849B0
MDATQVISDSILESDEEQNEEENKNKGSRPMAKLCILKNPHIPETELPLFLGDNVLGRDPSTCRLPFPAPSVSKQHATICISVYKRRGCHSDVGMEALVWDLGSMNGTRKGRLKLTPNVRYALSEGDSLVVADIPCQYVSCAADSVFSQDDMRTPGSRNSGVKVRLPDALGEGWGGTSTGSKKYVSGGAKARVSLKRTPVSGSCLFFKQTPTQPQGTLVPQSDSDSDSERGGRGDKKRKALVSDSDSHKSSPSSCPSSCPSSVFLSPADKIIPESEDESPITPSSSSRNGSYRHVSFSTEERDLDVGQQQQEKKSSPAILGNCLKEEEREARGETNSKESRQHVKPESNIGLTGESPLSTSEVSKDAIPAFNMDSDTDVDGEDEEAESAGPLCSTANQQTDQPPNTVHFHMDSDTDVDEDDDVSDKAPKIIPSSNDTTKPPHVASVIHPEGITMDSDTDVDDDASLTDAAPTARATSFQDAHTADAASSVQRRDFHLDSDTDVDEEVEGNSETANKNSTKDETPIKSDTKLIVPECDPVAPRSLHLDSDTDDEAVPAPAIGEPSAPAAVTKSCATADAGADLDIMSDSDTDEEHDSPLGIPVAVSNLPGCPGTMSEALRSDSDANTDVDEPIVPPAGDRANPADLRVDSDTDVEDTEAEDHIPNMLGLLVPHLQNCSTPAQMSEKEAEEMETQAFISPSSGGFRQPVGLSSCSDSQVDDDFLVAETQSFIPQTRDCQTGMDPTKASAVASSGDNLDEQTSRGRSFHLGLSDSSHLQCQGGALATESTQAFVSVEMGVNLEETQAYVAVSTADRTSVENDSNLAATLSYGDDEELAGDSEMSEKEACVDLALEATQSYISEPYNDPEDDSDEHERQNAAVIETQPSGSPTSSTLAVAEPEPETNNPVSSVQQVKTITRAERKAEHGKAAQPQERHLAEDQAIAETQPLRASESEDSDDEDSFPGPRKRMAKPLQLEEEQTQPLTCPLPETQPMVFCEDDESDEEDSMLFPRKRKAKQLHLEEEETQRLTNSELTPAETQPLAVSEDEDTDSMPGPRKRKAKPLQFEDETQSLANSEVSAAETQPLSECEGEQTNKDGVQTHSVLTGEDKKNDKEDSIPGPQKRKAKRLHIEEDETHKHTDSELSAVEVQPVVTCEDKDVDSMSGQLKRQTQPLTTTEVSESPSKGRDEESDGEESRSRPQKRKAKRVHLEEGETQPLSNSEVCTAETPLKAKTPETSGVSLTKSRETRARLREGEEEPQCSIPPKRRSRMESKTLTNPRGRREKARSDDDTTEEQMKPVKQTRGRRNTRQQVDDDEDDERKSALNKSPIKEQKEEKLQEREAEKERRETAEQERLQAEDAERVKIELERIEREEREVKERLEREDKERLERERKEQEQRESLETAKREQEERLARERKEHQTRQEIEEREKLEKEKHLKESQENKEEKEKSKAPARGRGAAKRTIAAQRTAEPEQDATSVYNDFPARRTRSRSNSSNSVSSERSISGVNTQDSKGGGRGRGARRSSQTPKTTTVRSSRRRTTVAAEPTEHNSNDNRAQELLSRPNSDNSVSSEISSCSVNTQNRGRGGRQRGRGRKTEPVLGTLAPVISESNHSSTARGMRSRRTKGSSSEALHEDEKERPDSQQAGTSRGRQRANAGGSEPAASNDEGQLNQEEGLADQKSNLPQRNVRGRGQKAVKTETVGEPVAPAVSDGDAVGKQRKGRKYQLEANTGVDRSKVKERAQIKQTAEEGKEEIPSTVQVRRTSRASSTLAKNNAKESFPEEEVEDGEKMEVETPKKKATGRTSLVRRNTKEGLEESGTSATSVNQDANVEASEPQTPASVVSRKRHTPADFSPVAKSPRSSLASPAASGRLRVGGQAYKVLFTGVVDEEGERVLARLGGSMAKGVADMNCLVTDKVRRTVKFLCAVAKGIPVVTTDWLEKSGKAGSFLSPNAFVVADPEQEQKFSFRLQESLRTASTQRLLQGYEIHVTKSVKPEPVHMRDIISSSGATFLPKMPSSHKPQTVVISCEEDWRLCGPAVSASLPVVTAEFVLTGILQQKLDFHTYVLSPPAATGGRGRGRRKTNHI